MNGFSSSPGPKEAPETGPTTNDRTVLLGLLGENIAQSLTPVMHENEAKRQGIPLVYRIIDPCLMGIAEPDWPALVEQAISFGFNGLNVTHPAKQSVIPALDELDEDATLLGAVNTIVVEEGRLIGRNTDHSGFTTALEAIHVDASAGEVIQIGAGGAGSAIAYALLSAGVPKLSIADINPASSRALIGRLSAAFDNSRMRAIAPDQISHAARGAVGLVNSTPIGMTGVSNASPFPVDALHCGMWVGDAVYRPLHTTLVKAAADVGCAVFGGAHMAVGQAAAAFTMFTGAYSDRESMLESFELSAAHSAK
ncbi:shikimate dehydrogenase [Brevibacterium zhoupengii]|uniref:shikimate dehydrogenase n=1 Tax=Brevibacterium zhoupengii TaxID=2898795 RepID=UPI001E318D6A|nr:shikimate dehydrogenase [Brevibacterium zhoupengii]